MATSWNHSSENMRVLVTVKAYPEIGQKHGETVCVAGIRVTENAPREWVRLYPVPFRDLPKLKQFRKYQFVDVRAVRPPEDRRPESWRIDVDNIVVGSSLDTSHGWAQRRQYVEPMLLESMCELQHRQSVDGTSLGAFRPGKVFDVTVEKAEGWSSSKKALAAQGKLLSPAVQSELEPLPWTFRYRYRCATSKCKGHTQKIIDWEIGQAWRAWEAESELERIAQIRSKWLDDIAGSQKDVVFFAGNMHKWPANFLILGVYYPPETATAQQQLAF